MKTFAEHILEELKDKLVEIMIGESYEELALDQISNNYPAIIVGKIINAFGNILVLECLYIKGKEIKSGKKIYINDFSIKVLTEVDGFCNLEDLLMRGNDAKLIKKLREHNDIK